MYVHTVHNNIMLITNNAAVYTYVRTYGMYIDMVKFMSKIYQYRVSCSPPASVFSYRIKI